MTCTPRYFCIALLISISVIWPEVQAQSIPYSRSRLEKAPLAVTLHGVKVSLTAELWYDHMPTVDSASKKHLLGVLRLVGEGNRMPAIAIDRAWILYQDRLWQCRVERQSLEPNHTVAEFRLLDTPTIGEIPAGSEVTAVVRLRLKSNRLRLLKALPRTVQSVY
jgi:hypothetical protein